MERQLCTELGPLRAGAGSAIFPENDIPHIPGNVSDANNCGHIRIGQFSNRDAWAVDVTK